MKKKECFKCGEVKTLSSFYRHKQMKDGHVNKCIKCNKKDVSEHRKDNLEKIRAYDRGRGNRRAYAATKEYRERFPTKYKAHTAVGNAKRRGEMIPEPCCECGREDTIHAHHDDYAKPLVVRWLCAAHHHQWHAKNGDGKNAT